MELDAPQPPDPPDPPMTSASKRRLESDENPPAKKTITSHELATASSETVYTDSTLVVGGLSYTSLDKGPYVVHVSRTEPDYSAGTTLRPIKFGQFLKTNKIANICADGIKRVGRNKISVEFTSADKANNFLSLPILASSKYTAVIPTYNITRMGLIRQVPTDLSMTEFVESLELPSGCGKVLKARRLSRKSIDEGKVSWIPTQTVVVTFQGQVLPTRVFSYYTSLPVELYQYPTIQCHSCCRFGHTKSQCRSKPRCFRCTKDHAGDSCDVLEKDSSCLLCSGHHFATNKNCPEQERQRSIKAVMAQKSISYEEAASQFPKVSRSFAEVSQVMFAPSPSSSQSSAPSQPSQSQSTRSYSKTVYAAPRPRLPPGKSYDKNAHHEIVAHPVSVLPNGCALGINPSAASIPQSDNMLETLITLIINIILMNAQPLPSNVASKLSQLISLSNNYGSSHNPAMEHPEHATQEA